MSCTRTSAWASRSPRVPRVPRFSLASLFARLSLRSPRFARSSFHTHHACSACLSPAPLASLLLTAAASPAFAPATRLLLLLPLAASPACGDRSFARLRSSAAHLIWLDRAAGSHCSLRSPLAYCWARSSCSSLACSSLTCFARLLASLAHLLRSPDHCCLPALRHPQRLISAGRRESHRRTHPSHQLLRRTLPSSSRQLVHSFFGDRDPKKKIGRYIPKCWLFGPNIGPNIGHLEQRCE